MPEHQYRVETHELTRRAGEQIKLHRSVDAPDGMRIELIGVPDGTPVEVELTLQSVGDGIWVSGTAHAQLAGQCSRCLEAITSEGDFTIEELYYYPGKPAEEEALFVDNEQIDLEPALRAGIVLELPFAPLCRPDCKGLCPQCGANLNDDPDHSHGPKIDPRWEKLGEFVTGDE